MTTNVWAALAVAAASLAAFLLALERRWFGRFHNGFLIVLVLTAAGIGLTSSLLVGIWGYESAERVLAEETVQELGTVGRVIEGEIGNDIAQAVAQMTGLAEALGPKFGSKAAMTGTGSEFTGLEHFNPRFLQLNVVDRRGELLLAVTRDGQQEPVSRVAVAFGLEGQSFASDPYYSSVFRRYVLLLGA